MALLVDATRSEDIDSLLLVRFSGEVCDPLSSVSISLLSSLQVDIICGETRSLLGLLLLTTEAFKSRVCSANNSDRR